MKRIFTLFLAVLFVSAAFAQFDQPVGSIVKASVAPAIDGEIDAVWSEANTYNIDRKFQSELPTLGAEGETTWKALWVEDEGFYLLLTVTDDVNWMYSGTGNDYEFDKPEIYFDVNYNLLDGLGSKDGQGHWQVAPNMLATNTDGTPMLDTINDIEIVYAFKLEDPNYVAEYFVPFSLLLDKNGAAPDFSGPIGFDVYISDNDNDGAGRKRATWANEGAKDQSWANMDESGIITFEGFEPPILIDDITISVDGDITENKQTLQIVAEVIPEDATDKTVIYKILEGSTARVTISNTGLITPITNGVLIVGATDPTEFVDPAANAITITISGQIPTIDDLSFIKNGDMNMVESDGRATYWTGSWTDASPAHKIIDGVSVHTPVVSETDPQVWRYQFSQDRLQALPNKPYIYKFKAWADAERSLTTDFEDGPNDNNRFGASTDPRSSNGRADWTFDITTEPTWYTFDVIFDEIVETTNQKVIFLLGLSDIVTYIDSIYLIEDNSEIIDVDDIILTGGTISTDNGTLQIGAEIVPANATNKTIKWSVATAEGSTGRANISNKGLLTAILDGTVTVTAKSNDDFIEKTVDVEISGQVITEEDLNIIKNGKFDLLNADGVTANFWGGWTDASPAHKVVDGVSVHTPVGASDIWRYQFTQNALTALPNIPYVFKFKAWADSDRSFTANFEDTGDNANNRYGASNDPRANVPNYEGRSEWKFDITTEPTEYTFDVIFDEIIESTDQKVVFHLGLSNIVTYIDDVLLISEADMALLPTAIKQNSMQPFKVYPNPAVDKLHINLITPNAVVAIYNSVGVKMDEVNVAGTQHTFDVSRYTKGLYFVKANGTVVKFIK